ncbi:Hypothetical predicted protein [Octopus vulgaris]|uniref:Uncharacterized protein n=1 Tax=Octopus vulgaris TaxID=6645 RepID=A0AA36AQR4_OCTVU|nr:Hypothetical predicted protein [Octopus vulgaris]
MEKDYCDESYFAVDDNENYHHKHKIVYPNLDSAMRTVPHNGSLPIPVPPVDGIQTLDDDADCHDSAAEEDYVADDDSFEPQKLS